MKTYQEMFDELKDDFTRFPDEDLIRNVMNRRFKVNVYDVRYYDEAETRLYAKDFVDYFDEYDEDGKKTFESVEDIRTHFLQKAHQVMGWNIPDCRIDVIKMSVQDEN